jgi:hypothetical protein
VERRPQPRPPLAAPYAGVAAAIAVFVLTPATWAAVDAFDGTPAPPSIHQTFLQWDAQAAAMEAARAEDGFSRHVPRADASMAHGVLQVATTDGPLDMWAAPELEGSGTCWFVGWESDMNGDNVRGGGSCTDPDGDAINPGWEGPSTTRRTRCSRAPSAVTRRPWT